MKVTYPEMQNLRNQAYLKGKTKETRQKAFEVLLAEWKKTKTAQQNAQTVIDVKVD